MQDLEQAIRECAYQLWISDGCREGKAEDYWLCAQREVLAATLGNFGTVTVAESTSEKKRPEIQKQHLSLKGSDASRRLSADNINADCEPSRAPFVRLLLDNVLRSSRH